jgi:DNA-binding NtrC family response regulator
METKKLLFVAPKGEASVPIKEFTGEDWDVTTTSPQQSTTLLVEQNLVHVTCVEFPKNPDVDFNEWLCWLCHNAKNTQWIALVPHNCLISSEVQELICHFFYDFHILPANIEDFRVTLMHAYSMATVVRAVYKLWDVPDKECEIIGTSVAIQQTIRNLHKFAEVDAPVLITGESGTGKELAARTIHRRSQRANGPFLAVNCGALLPSLVQSELFGHERGSFTGAHQRKIGRIERAHGGTLLLDEIGDLQPDIQVNLLRFLEGSYIERVGGTEKINVDVRIIAATHVNLEEAMKTQHFREDLYYRLNVLSEEIPPLRERGKDKELLAKFFLEKYRCESKRSVIGFNKQALNVIMTYHWPGNVRELSNRVRRAVAMCENRLISPANLDLERRQDIRCSIPLRQVRDMAEKKAIVATLRQSENNVTQAARQLEISRAMLYKLIEKHEIVLSNEY